MKYKLNLLFILLMISIFHLHCDRHGLYDLAKWRNISFNIPNIYALAWDGASNNIYLIIYDGEEEDYTTH